MPNKTPLFESHIKSQAKIVDFHGWEMPINYGSQIQEHLAVRNDVGMFDVSHMNIIDLHGADCNIFLQKLLTNDISQLKSDNQALYTCLCNEDGGILDDLIVYRLKPDLYRLILNSATREKDLCWIKIQLNSYNITIHERTDLAMIAVQGPNAIAKVAAIFAASQEKLHKLAPFNCLETAGYFFARTGYTGEDGLEIISTYNNIIALWGQLINSGVMPCGLGARDTLRLEAGLLLYGQDMDENTTPLESGLAWTVKLEPHTREFIGMEAIAAQKQSGVPRALVGLILNEPGIMRAGQVVHLPGAQTGIITSGTFSPTLDKSIALARIPNYNINNALPKEALVEIRGKKIPATITKPRFVKHGKIIA